MKKLSAENDDNFYFLGWLLLKFASPYLTCIIYVPLFAPVTQTNGLINVMRQAAGGHVTLVGYLLIWLDQRGPRLFIIAITP